jgi:hypothetical protein
MVDFFQMFSWPSHISTILGITIRKRVQMSSGQRFPTEALAAVVWRPMTPI